MESRPNQKELLREKEVKLKSINIDWEKEGS